MNDYSKDKIEIINPPTTVIGDNNFDNDNAMELFNYTYHLRDAKYFDDIIKYGKNRHRTTKHQPNKKSKKNLLVEIIDGQKEIIVKLIKILVKL